MGRFLATLLLLVVHLHFTHTLQATTLHALLIGDYYSSDIKEAARVDIQHMEKEMREIAHYGGCDLSLSIFRGDQRIAQKILRGIEKMRVHQDDLIIFYFSGHGYRTQNLIENPWPHLSFAVEERGISFKKIIEMIRSKEARLSLLIADCCNVRIPYRAAPPLISQKKTGQKESKKAKMNYQRLFYKTEGVIAIASCKAGQLSYCIPYGSFYTVSFLKSLHRIVRTTEAVSWEQILADTNADLTNALRAYDLEQDPVVYQDIR